MNNKDNFSKTLSLFTKTLSEIPELSETISIVKSNVGIKKDFASNPIDYIRVILFDYLYIIRSLTNLSDKDLKLVTNINKRRNKEGLDTNPLGQHGLDVFYSKLDKDTRNYYWKALIASLDGKSDIFDMALKDLAKRMSLASNLAKDNVTLKDGDPMADKVIWGHTKGLKTEALIHFVICHFIDRLTYQILVKTKKPNLVEFVNNKHYLFDPFGDMVFLLTTKRMINTDISEKWILTRENGGLKWNTPEEQKIFDEEYNK